MPRRPRAKPDSDVSQPDWYDYPHWYDIIHSPGTAAEVRGLERLARCFDNTSRVKNRPPTWLEPACGSGRYLRTAIKRGVRAVGLDSNRAMIEYAQKRMTSEIASRQAKVQVGDMTNFALAKSWHCDFAFCLINTIRHLDSDSAMLAHLECVARALRPGGMYAVGISLTRYGHEFASEDVWKASRGRCHVHQLVSYFPPEKDRMEKVITHLTITTPTDEHHLDSTYNLRTYSGSQWKKLINRSAMELVAVVDEVGDELPCRSGDWFSDAASGYGVFVLSPRR